MGSPERADRRRKEAAKVRPGAGDGDDPGPRGPQVGGGGVPALLNVSFMTVPAWLVILGIGVARTDEAPEASLVPQMGPA